MERKRLSIHLIELAKKMEELGVGEIILNDIDRDGTLLGYDTELIRSISKELSIPLVDVGGASSIEDFKKAKEAGAHACRAGTMFVFHGPHRAVLILCPRYEELKMFLGNNLF